MNRQIKKVFDKYDIEDDGYLNGDRLCKALIELKLPVQPEDALDLLESVGRQKEGTIDLDGFADIVMELKDDKEEEEYFIPEEQKNNSDVVYRILKDSNAQGITIESLSRVCAAQEPSWTHQQVMEMLNEADSNHDGIIDLRELEVVCKRVYFMISHIQICHTGIIQVWWYSGCAHCFFKQYGSAFRKNKADVPLF
ncbi:unnamed protein product [Rhizopus stolonifer]